MTTPDSVMDITNHAIKSLTQKAGITTLGQLSYTEIRTVLVNELTRVVNATVTVTEYEKRKRIQAGDVKKALETIGRQPYHRNCTQVSHQYRTVEEARAARVQLGHPVSHQRTVKHCSRKDPVKCTSLKIAKKPEGVPRAMRGEVQLKHVEHSQRKGNCMNIPKASFRRVIKDIGATISTNLQYSPEALDMIQTDLEYYLLDILAKALELTLHSGRKTVQPKDIELAMKTSNLTRA